MYVPLEVPTGILTQPLWHTPRFVGAPLPTPPTPKQLSECLFFSCLFFFDFISSMAELWFRRRAIPLWKEVRSIAKAPMENGAHSIAKAPVENGVHSIAKAPGETGVQSVAKAPMEIGAHSIAKAPVENGVQSVAKAPVENGAHSIAKAPVENGAQSIAKALVENGAQSVAKAPVEIGAQSIVKAMMENGAQAIATAPVENGARSIAKALVENGVQSIATAPLEDGAQSISRAPVENTDLLSVDLCRVLPAKEDSRQMLRMQKRGSNYFIEWIPDNIRSTELDKHMCRCKAGATVTLSGGCLTTPRVRSLTGRCVGTEQGQQRLRQLDPR